MKYLEDLVVKIKELIKITNGRTLVLFTSKSDMNYVFSEINKEILPFRIFIQGDSISNSQLYKEFEKDDMSCLFSTGAWEGIDIKGKSLSNVIIARLPFAVDNAIMQYKAKHSTDLNNSVFLSDMIQKLAQGTGRLIRCSDDKGIICCLDSRLPNYQKYIQSILPFTKYTDNLDDICSFSSKNITNNDNLGISSGSKRVKKLIKNEDNN